MKYIKTYEKEKDKNALAKSDFTFDVEQFSKIDPTKKIVIETYMKCPVCGEKMTDMAHGEIRKCKKCKTRMQTFGNGLKINVDRFAEDPFHGTNSPLSHIHTKDFTIEDLYSYEYINKDKIKCPLCKDIFEHHLVLEPGYLGKPQISDRNKGKTIYCPTCNLEIKYNGEHSMLCKIDNKKLDFYRTADKYNL